MGNTALGPPAHDPHMNGAEIIWVDISIPLVGGNCTDFETTFD